MTPLWTVADVPAGNPVTAFAGWEGRLRVLACWQCLNYQTLYCEAGPGGSVAWWAGNVQPEQLLAIDGTPSRVPALGVTAVPAEPRGRYTANGWFPRGSALGGHPDWVREAHYQRCPTCGDLMNYIGMLSGPDIDEFCEAAYYLHLHAPCGLAAVSVDYH